MNKKLQMSVSEISKAIVAADEATIQLEELLKLWKKNNAVCFAVVENNLGYFDTTIRSYHLTKEDAENAKPQDTRYGWEQCTYHISEIDTRKLGLETLKQLFKK